MYRAVQTVISILAKDKDNGTTISDSPGRGINELESVEFVIINASDIHFASVDMENFGVTTEDATIGTTVHEGTTGAACMCADSVGDDRGIIGRQVRALTCENFN